MRLKYVTGLDDEELDDLVMRVEKLLLKPWNKATGRHRKLSLRDAVAITCAYKRQNIIQEVLGAIWDVSQEVVSEVITAMTPLIKEATREFVPTPEDNATNLTFLLASRLYMHAAGVVSRELACDRGRRSRSSVPRHS